MDTRPLRIDTQLVDGREYDFYQLKASEQLKTLTLIAKQFGHGLTDFLSSMLQKVKENSEAIAPENLLKELSINESEITTILKNIITNLDDEIMIRIIDTLMKGVRHRGQTVPIKWEFEFQGRMAALFKVSYLAFMTNYKDFLFKSSGSPT